MVRYTVSVRRQVDPRSPKGTLVSCASGAGTVGAGCPPPKVRGSGAPWGPPASARGWGRGGTGKKNQSIDCFSAVGPLLGRIHWEPVLDHCIAFYKFLGFSAFESFFSAY